MLFNLQMFNIMGATQKVKLSKSEAYSLIEEYFSSGELPSVFYRRVGLSDNQFYGWRKKYLRDHPSLAKRLGISIASNPPRNASYKLPLNTTPPTSVSEVSSPSRGFARVEVSDTSAHHASFTDTSLYELCYPNGVVLRLPTSTAIPSLAELIKLY